MNQLVLEFLTEGSEIPVNYNSSLLSFIKFSVEKYDNSMYQKLFGENSTITKSYCFSCNFRNPIFGKDKIHIDEFKFRVYFSTYSADDLLDFYNIFVNNINTTFPLKENKIKLNNIKLIKLKTIVDDEILIKMDSPLVARQHNNATNKDKYLTYLDDNFEDTIRTTIQNILNDQNITIDTDSFSITPVKPKKTVVPLFGLMVNSNIGIYKIKGNPKLLNFLYYSGIGSARSNGHGKFSILG